MIATDFLYNHQYSDGSKNRPHKNTNSDRCSYHEGIGTTPPPLRKERERSKGEGSYLTTKPPYSLAVKRSYAITGDD